VSPHLTRTAELTAPPCASRRTWSGAQGHGRLVHVDRLSLRLAGAHEIHRPIDAPRSANGEGDVRFLDAHAGHGERPYQVEQHAEKVGDEPEERNHEVFEAAAEMVLADGDDSDDAGQHVEQEGAEVAD